MLKHIKVKNIPNVIFVENVWIVNCLENYILFRVKHGTNLEILLRAKRGEFFRLRYLRLRIISV